MLNLTEMAERLAVNPHTVKRRQAAGLLVSHKSNDKNERLYEAPVPGDPRPVPHLGRRLSAQARTDPATGVLLVQRRRSGTSMVASVSS